MHKQARDFFKSHSKDYMEKVQTCIRNRVKVQHVELMNNSLTILATYGWGRDEDASIGQNALTSVCAQFQVPLERAGIDTSPLSRMSGMTWLSTQNATLI